MNLTVEWVQTYSLRDTQPIETEPVTFIPVIRVDVLRRWLEMKMADRYREYSEDLTDLLAQLPEAGT